MRGGWLVIVAVQNRCSLSQPLGLSPNSKTVRRHTHAPVVQHSSPIQSVNEDSPVDENQQIPPTQ